MTMIRISLDEAHRNAADLFERVKSGASFIIERDSKPIAVLGPPPEPLVSIDEAIARLDSLARATQTHGDIYETGARHPEPSAPKSHS